MTESPLTQAPSGQILHDIRAVADVCDLDLQALDADRAAPWLVVRVVPDPGSGSATAPDVVIDGDSGRVVGSAGTALIVRAGRFEVLSSLGAAPPQPAGRYAWSEPVPMRSRGLNRDALYDPFALGGTVVARYRAPTADDPQGAAFDGVHLLPPGWADDVGEAVSTVGRDVAPDEGALAAEGTPPPTGNAVVFAQTVSAMARRSALTPDTLAGLYRDTEGYRRAVVHFSALQHGDDSTVEVAWTQATADLSGDPATARAGALGLAAAHLFGGPQGRPAHAAIARDVLSTSADEYVSEGLRLLGA